MECLKDYEILLGTYEAFVLGYKLTEDRKYKDRTQKTEPSVCSLYATNFI